MSTLLILGCLWVLAATATAFLPMRWQIYPGLALLAAAPVLIILLGQAYGAWVAMLAVAAFGSMFRRPLWHLARHIVRKVKRA